MDALIMMISVGMGTALELFTYDRLMQGVLLSCIIVIILDIRFHFLGLTWSAPHAHLSDSDDE